MTSASVRRALAAACVAPLLLAGCTNAEPTPDIPDPTPSESPTATETETGPVEPTLPPEAEGRGPEAAQAFVAHYYDYLSYAQATGETRGAKSLGLPSCAACGGALGVVETVARKNATSTGGVYTVESAKVTGKRERQATVYYYLTVKVAHTEQVISGAGEIDGTYPPGVDTLRFEVVRDAKTWHVASWALA